MYDAIEDISYMTRGSNNPAMEQYLADGFHDMLKYVLTEKDGIRGTYNRLLTVYEEHAILTDPKIVL